MLKSLIKKYNVNVYSMLKNGTVAVITMFGVWILFGVKLLGFHGKVRY